MLFSYEQKERRADRRVSRKFHNSFYKDNSTLDMDLYEKIINAITGKSTGGIDISRYTSRQLIVADYYVNKKFFEPLLLKMEKPEIPSYELRIFNTTLKITPKPAHGHIGNFIAMHEIFMHGGYGGSESLPYNDIIEVLNRICKFNSDDDNHTMLKERSMAQIMLQFMRNGPNFYNQSLEEGEKEEGVYLTYNGISEDESYHDFTVVLSDATKVYFTIYAFEFSSLIAICYIVCVKEVSRRMASEEYYTNNPNHYGKDLPFSIALFRSLKLLEKGLIRLKEIFAENAPYGISTGKRITIFSLEGMKATKGKLNTLNTKFVQEFYKSEKSITENFASSMGIYMDHLNPSSESEQDCWSDHDSSGHPRPIHRLKYLF